MKSLILQFVIYFYGVPHSHENFRLYFYKPSQKCHPERSEGSLTVKVETLSGTPFGTRARWGETADQPGRCRSQPTLPHIVPMSFGRVTQHFETGPNLQSSSKNLL